MQATGYLLSRYFDAPGAGMASLQGHLQQLSLPQITVVFCGIEQADVMKVAFGCGPASHICFICQSSAACTSHAMQREASLPYCKTVTLASINLLLSWRPTDSACGMLATVPTTEGTGQHS